MNTHSDYSRRLRTLLSGAILAGLTLATLPALSAAPGGGGGGGGEGERPRKERRERPERGEMLERLRQHLELTDAQVEQLKPIFAEERAELKAAMQELGQDATPEERREVRQEVHEKYKPRIGAVLTEEQKAKLEEMRKKGPRGKGAGGPPPAE
jgi:Spy/CpxP family protein refolding chaperone